jgi:hypothetical protein
MPLTITRACAISLALFAIAQAPSVSAEAVIKFCDIDTEDACMLAALKNRSSATVLSVDIVQKHIHREKGSCTGEERKITRNMTGGWNNGKQLRIHVYEHCRYKVTFNTTGTCSGDKTGQFSAENLENKRRQMTLDGACGSLSTRTSRAENIDHDAGEPDS